MERSACACSTRLVPSAIASALSEDRAAVVQDDYEARRAVVIGGECSSESRSFSPGSDAKRRAGWRRGGGVKATTLGALAFDQHDQAAAQAQWAG
jgi:hypothetical protein